MILTVTRLIKGAFLRYLFFIIIIIACSPKSTKQSVSRKSSSADLQNETDSNLSSGSNSTIQRKPLPKVDGKSLKIFNLNVGKLSDSGVNSTVVSYAASGGTQYVLWKLCPEEEVVKTETCIATEDQTCGFGGACVQNVTSYNKFILPMLYAGNVFLSVQACVEPDNAVNSQEACGPFTEMRYNSHINNTQVMALFAKREDIINALDRLGKEKMKLYSDYKGDLMSCLKNDAKNAEYYQVKIAVVDTLVNGLFFRWLTWPGDALAETTVGQVVWKGLKEHVYEPIKEIVHKLCSVGDSANIDKACITKLNDSNSTMTTEQKNAYCTKGVDPGFIVSICGMLDKLGTALIGFASGMNPAVSIPTLTGAVQTLFSSNPVPRQCHAEENLAKASEAIDKTAAGYSIQLIEIDNQLRSLGQL